MIVGLGNPGPEYKGTRHNVGFDAIDLLAERNKIKLDRGAQQARTGTGLINGHAVLLVKPLTFMNNSGRSVAPLSRSTGIPPEKILVIADDLDLTCGRTRLKPKGGAGGHNGHKSIIASIGTEEYPRIKIGIGSVDRGQTIDHVLGKFDPEERSDINVAIDRTVKGIEVAIEQGIEAAMTIINVGSER
ncbi:MAG TPA: aminoacyl-tRNA hydrolase [Fimbriimonas sp.]|nr:aminoacyl-tRNA hydrolase [Fimbriimonas sp.]